jgi:sporulation protein YlmC with PRC-barrel domain
MENDEMKWLLKGKIVCDFRGFPLGRVKKVWFDESSGPMVIVERDGSIESKKNSWEAIPLRAVDSVTEHVRLKPPAFAE